MCSNPNIYYVTPTILYYLRDTLCFAHFQTLKIMNCIFAIFHQIHRLLYANSENFIFFSHGLQVFRIKLNFRKNWKTVCRSGCVLHPPQEIDF